MLINEYTKANRKGISDHIRYLNTYCPGIIVFEEPKIIYMKLARTGGTSILRELRKQCKMIKGYVRLDWMTNLTDNMLEDYTIFAFVRDPWDRVMSISRYFSHKPKSIIFGRVKNREISNTVKAHSFSCTTFTHKNGQIFVDFLGRFERLQNDFNFLCETIGLKTVRLPHLSKTRRNTKHKTHFNSRLKDGMKNKYGQDISLLEYNFND